jgi:hypothetical protein
VNLGKSRASVSIGGRGVWLAVGVRGRRATLSVERVENAPPPKQGAPQASGELLRGVAVVQVAVDPEPIGSDQLVPLVEALPASEPFSEPAPPAPPAGGRRSAA